MSVKLAKVERFLRVGRNDEAHLAFEIDADLTSVFSWNTKQLFVWLAAEYATPKYVESSVSVWDRASARSSRSMMGSDCDRASASSSTQITGVS